MSFKYAINTNCLRQKFSPQQICRLCKDAGIQGVEWGLGPVESLDEQVKQMQDAADEYGIETVGFVNGGQLWKTDLIRLYSEAVASVNGRMLRVTPPWFAYDYKESVHQKNTIHELFNLCRKGIEKLVDLSNNYGIKYVLEIHMGSLCNSADSALRLLKGINPENVGIIYDPANGVEEGFTRPRYAIELLGKYLANVHAKNMIQSCRGFVDCGDIQRMKWSAVVCELETGIVDWLEVISALKITGYNGWITFEQFYTFMPEQQIKKAIKFLNKCNESAPAQPVPPFTSFNE
jgi:sugar phosphate isomerase/epimerase